MLVMRNMGMSHLEVLQMMLLCYVVVGVSTCRALSSAVRFKTVRTTAYNTAQQHQQTHLAQLRRQREQARHVSTSRPWTRAHMQTAACICMRACAELATHLYMLLVLRTLIHQHTITDTHSTHTKTQHMNKQAHERHAHRRDKQKRQTLSTPTSTASAVAPTAWCCIPHCSLYF